MHYGGNFYVDTPAMGMVSWAARDALTDPRGRNILRSVMFHLVVILRK